METTILISVSILLALLGSLLAVNNAKQRRLLNKISVSKTDNIPEMPPQGVYKPIVDNTTTPPKGSKHTLFNEEKIMREYYTLVQEFSESLTGNTYEDTHSYIKLNSQIIKLLSGVYNQGYQKGLLHGVNNKINKQ